ncbi:hypothetical protein ACER0A_008380 [Haloimpatiens sp. FM7315]|uniref:hypothetical protein n=1 Tax=Haloimpatiens sp. FM7315 TaxID=3298609 RepID=UPI0035A360D1
MSKRCCCCCNAPVSCQNSSGCFGNICNPFCLVVLLIALKKGEVIKDQSTIEALFFIFLLLCCCNNKGAGFGCGASNSCCNPCCKPCCC